jgi:hypothetical protein
MLPSQGCKKRHEQVRAPSLSCYWGVCRSYKCPTVPCCLGDRPSREASSRSNHGFQTRCCQRHVVVAATGSRILNHERHGCYARDHHILKLLASSALRDHCRQGCRQNVNLAYQTSQPEETFQRPDAQTRNLGAFITTSSRLRRPTRARATSVTLHRRWLITERKTVGSKQPEFQRGSQRMPLLSHKDIKK